VSNGFEDVVALHFKRYLGSEIELRAVRRDSS
jgi:hypothetical protein